MKISVPIEQDLENSNIIDSTDEFSNESSDDIAVDKEFQQDNEIYQNITGANIPVRVYDALDAYSIGDLVFKDDGLGTDRVHEITATSGSVVKEPEQYVATDSSFNELDWSKRYLKLETHPEGASTHGVIDKMGDYLYYQEIMAVEFSPDGTKCWIAATLGQTSYYYSSISEFSLGVPWDISTRGSRLVYRVYNNFVSSMSFSRDGTHIFFTVRNRFAVESCTSNWVYCYALATPWSMASYTFNSNRELDLLTTCVRARNSTDTISDNYFYTLTTDGNIRTHNMTTSWQPNTSSVTATVQLASVFAYAVAFEWINSGTKIFVLTGSITANPTQQKIQEYDCTTAHSASAFTYTTVNIPCETHYTQDIAISVDGTKLIELSWDMRSLLMSTTNSLATAFFAVFPLYHTETRDGIVYIYEVTYSTSTTLYTFKSTKNGVVSSITLSGLLYNVGDPALEEKAFIAANGTWLGKTVYLRPEGVYMRTNINADVETIAIVEYQTTLVTFVKNIKGMAYIRPTLPYNVMDGRNNTLVTVDGNIEYTLIGTNSFDTLAVGNVKGETITVTFIKVDGTVLTPIVSTIDASRDADGNLVDWYTTLIFYSSEVISPVLVGDVMTYGTVIIEIAPAVANDTTEVGTLMLGMSADAGFSNLAMSHKYKDFSTFEYDQWGQASYIERAKVSTYSGTVDTVVEDYDRTNRLMMSLGRNVVIINGSDEDSTQIDGIGIFAATQKIGRFLSFEQKTSIKANDINKKATYSFTIEEIV